MGRGTGLGLATVYGIVAQSGGQIHVNSEPGLGTTFWIYLPRIAAEQSLDRDRLEVGEAPRGTETILVVEDEAAVRVLAVRVLRQLGYAVLEAADGAEAIEVLRARNEPIDLLLTDVIMPGLSGPELVSAAQAMRPDLRFSSCPAISTMRSRVIVRWSATLVCARLLSVGWNGAYWTRDGLTPASSDATWPCLGP